MYAEPDTTKSEIQQFYAGKTVFITGASGFLGRLLVEKLLRSCPDIKRIYILLREKKEKLPQERFKEIFDVPAFEVLKSVQPNFLSKISLLEGDLTQPSLGLSENSKSTIINEVNCIFHVAATVRFDEKLKRATHINVRAVRDLLGIAKEARCLESFIHVSTAYSNCTRKDIGEIFYEPPLKGQKLLDLVECLDDRILDDVTSSLLRDNPNTYVLTKSVGEDIIKNESENLTVGIVRPSIVISTYKEPIPGWLDNLYGPTSLLVGAALGLLRTTYGRSSNVADLVPADFVINTILASGWDIAQNYKKIKLMEEQKNQTEDKGPKIYNYVSCVQNPITWGEYKDLAREFALQVPSPLVVWHATFDIYSNYYVHWILAFLLQTVPAYIIDFLAKFVGKNPMFVRIFKKIDKFCDVISYFTMRQWNFKNDNVQDLWHRLSEADKALFNFDMKSMTWRSFFSVYIVGARLYLLKDPLDTLPKGRRKLLAVKIGHYFIVSVFCLLLCKLFMIIWSFF